VGERSVRVKAGAGEINTYTGNVSIDGNQE